MGYNDWRTCQEDQMESQAPKRSEALQRFQELLRELFEFECADLDFGIYRIMNHKREIIKDFIENKLPNIIREELSQGTLAEQTRAHQELQQAAAAVRESLGEYAIKPDGSLLEQFRGTPVGKQYLEALQKATHARSSEAVETAIYNHLYTFFSRYWQDGDFISKRRYSKRERYAIPYNGEEVYLYWANHDQYYIKTAEHFTDYSYKAPNGVTVHFKLRQADVELNNVKGEKRFFLPQVDAIEWDAQTRTLTIPFEYRPLTPEEQKRYGEKNQQKTIIDIAVNEIPKRVQAACDPESLTAERRKTDEGISVSYLEHHLRRYTRRNTSDFFIHKDLKGFLSRELDFYLKNEVLNLDEMERAGEDLAEGWFQLLRIIKRIGMEIIEFLAQIENFQKMLWEKKKFVTETFYCITVGNIPEDFYPEIAQREAQWEEWKTLYHIHEESDGLLTADLETPEGRIEFLKAHPTLVLDTRHFLPDFTDRLLAHFENLDDAIDGLLIHSENWQALNLLQERYRERVKCIYIDPPYNTAAAPIIYKNDYKDSSWLSLMNDRLKLGWNLLHANGIISVAIDDEEVSVLRFVLSSLFPNELGVSVVRSNPAGRKTKGKLAPAHEYALFYGKTENALPGYRDITSERLKRFPLQDSKGYYAWANFMRSGSNDRREDRPTLYYPIVVTMDNQIRIPKMRWNKNTNSYDLLEQINPGETIVYPVVKKGNKVIEKNWQRGYERVMQELENYRVKRDRDGNIHIYFKTYLDEESLPTTWWDNKEYASANYGAIELKSLFVEKNFDFPKSTSLVRDCILTAGGRDENSLCLDFFAGSGTTGHAVINLNREDGGRRKFILVEMADYFDTVLLPRLKKVIFTPEWKEGKPKRMATDEEAKRSPRILKVIRLESYEDALNNLTFDEASGQKMLERFGDEYLLRYMLVWETRRSETLLNVEKLAAPFCYKLKIHRDGETQERTVDLPETFNYLLGLEVQKRLVHHENGRRYLIYRGALPNERTAVVIWRDIQGWTDKDFQHEATIVADQKWTQGADEVYVNGDSSIPNAQSLDDIFKRRLFAPVEA
jgi:adenine-specific DNA-methyltransferase